MTCSCHGVHSTTCMRGWSTPRRSTLDSSGSPSTKPLFAFVFCIFCIFFYLVDFPSIATILSFHPESLVLQAKIQRCIWLFEKLWFWWMCVCACVRARVHAWAKFKAKQQLVLVVLPRRLPSKCDKKFCRQPLSKSGKLPFYGCHMSSKGAGRRISVS